MGFLTHLEVRVVLLVARTTKRRCATLGGRTLFRTWRLELPAREMNANRKELAEEEFATLTPTRVEAVELDQLYLCEITLLEHGLRLGLGMPRKVG